MSTAPILRDELEHLVEISEHVIVDVRETQFIDCSTARELIRARDLAEASEVSFHLLHGTVPTVSMVLNATGVLPHLNAITTLNDAADGTCPARDERVAPRSPSR